MEVAGLAIGVVGLLGLFKDCIDLLSQIAALQDHGRDYEILNLKLDIEKTLLLQWASRLRLVQDDYDRRLDAKEVQQTVSRVLAGIKYLFLETNVLTKKYGLREAKEQELKLLEEPCPAISETRLGKFIRDFEQLNIRIRDRDTRVLFVTKTQWVIKDKDKFERLINELSHFIKKLNEIIPDNQNSIFIMTDQDIKTVTDLDGWQRILSACNGRQKVMADVAKQKIQDICQRRILGSIWFQSMDNRREYISRPHNGTFEWALKQRESNDWDDLPDWFRTGGGIYWVSGKAGSGKSTFMKFLHAHYEARSLLSIWARPASLQIASCFLWNLGSMEQKSLNGLLRTLLYHLLKDDPSRIQDLLPGMWKNVIEDEFAALSLPTLPEMMAIFRQLAQEPRDMKFCFFIDGLDEYSGNFAHAIEAITTLCKGPHIKAIVSSRPIPICVEAFKKMPTLKLQDLTKPDIAQYIHDTVGTHPYLHQLMQAESMAAASLLRELTEKASGVFLWVVIASRSLLNGFTAFDRVTELRERINELPPELEDLFRHMLDRVDDRYHTQSVKILRLAYYNRAVVNGGFLQALGLALVDDHEMDLAKMQPPRHLSTTEKQAKCVMLEGRLRSRCGGLLEIHGSGAAIIDSTVEFMHRSVFEFLDSPPTWELDCFKFDDNMFDPYAVLSAMSLHLAELKAYEQDASVQVEHHIVEALQYGALADRSTQDSMMTVFDQIERLLRNVELSSGQWPILGSISANSRTISFGRQRSIDSAGIGTLLLAIEANVANVAKRRLHSIGKKALTMASKFPLLYHAISRPTLAAIPGYPLDEEFPISRGLVGELLFSGCDPNEVFTDIWGCTTTPWRCWLECMAVTDVTTAARTADITMHFLDTGVSLQVVEETFGETLEDRVHRLYFENNHEIREGRKEVENRGYALLRQVKAMDTLDQEDSTSELLSGECGNQTKRPFSSPDDGFGRRTRQKY
ncbi:hypothetical protein G7054_g6921 [Neopestalotiopsis clavispora]|nr:hypothetical protein G7054_g6921 [Neopestalotiopsis clavispora]